MSSTLVRFAAAASLTVAVSLAGPASAQAANSPTVPLGTAAEYSVIGASTVTNTGPSLLNLSLAVHPGLAATGFPPGLVVSPGTTHLGDANALQAQSDLTVAYTNAALRPVDQTVSADLVGLTLQAGTYATSGNGALLLNGNVTLDGAGDPTSVFIFQTGSSLTTGSASTVTLINGAQACNVFWQVGSSATLGTGSSFAGNILALTSISVSTGVTVHGRALARNGAVTLDNDTFTAPSCDVSATSAPDTPSAPDTSGVPAVETSGGAAGTPASTQRNGSNPVGGNGGSDRNLSGNVPPTLAFTGGRSGSTLILAGAVIAVGAASMSISRCWTTLPKP